MLVLTRKAGESILIGTDVRIKVIEIRGNQIRLGVEAPLTMRVIREELHRAVANANLDASQGKVKQKIASDLAKRLRKK